jgi:uncharacterized protein YjdB
MAAITELITVTAVQRVKFSQTAQKTAAVAPIIFPMRFALTHGAGALARAGGPPKKCGLKRQQRATRGSGPCLVSASFCAVPTKGDEVMRNLFLKLAAVLALAVGLASCGGDATPSSQSVAVTGVGLDQKEIRLTVGGAMTLGASVRPAGATNKGVTWASSNTSVAMVTGSGPEVTIRADAIGTATITVKTADGDHAETCLVTVGDDFAVTGVTLDRAAMDLAAPGVGMLTASLQPPSAANRGIAWTSSNEAVATVEVGVGGTAFVAAKTNGAAVITARTDDGGYTAACIVTVGPYTVPVLGLELSRTSTNVSVGRRGTLTVTLQPSNAASGVAWSTSNSAVATVAPVVGNGLSAVVSGISLGQATITAALGGKTATCSVNVITEPGIFVAGNYGLYLDGGALINDHAMRCVAGDESGNIHAVGENADHRAVYYRNGAPTLLAATHGTDTFATKAESILVAPGGDVYISGGELFGGGSEVVARLWKNGAIVPLQGVDETGHDGSYAVAAHVYGNDVYVAGYIDEIIDSIHDYYKRPAIWRNGQLTAKMEFEDMQIVDFDIDSRGVLHVLCYNHYYRYTTIYPMSYPYTYWMVSPDLAEWTNVSMPPVGGYYQEMLHVFVDGDDVYLAGDSGTSACYWLNGVRNTLALPAGAGAAEVDDVYVRDGQVYAAGTALLSNNSYRPLLWIGGDPIADKGIAQTFRTYSEAMSHRIFAQSVAKVSATRVSISSGALDVPVRYSNTLTAAVSPANATFKFVNWSSSNPAVASVAGNGNAATINGLAVGGPVTITAASHDGVTATCQVNVVSVPVAGIELPANRDVGLTRSSTLTATLAPYYATNAGVTWVSSDASVAAVSGSGLAAAVSGVGAGTAVITARTQEGNYTATCTVRVVPAYQSGDPSIFVAGTFGLYMDDRRDFSINSSLSDVFVDGQGNVHAVGQYNPGASESPYRRQPAYFRNGVMTLLPTKLPTEELLEITRANRLCVASDNSVYISGTENGMNGDVVARLWRVAPNGAAAMVPLTGMIDDGTNATFSVPFGVYQHNGDIYMVGMAWDANWRETAMIWKNGEGREMPAMMLYDWLIDLGFASSGNMYTLSDLGVLFYVASDLSFMRRVERDEGVPLRLHVQGDDVYLVGYFGDDACYWKNGARHTLPRPAGGGAASARDIRVYDGHTYILGTVSDRLALWVDYQYVSDRPLAGVSSFARMDVRHYAKTPATSVTMSPAALTLPLGVTDTLTATALPANATNRGVVWTNSNPAVASITATMPTAAGGTATVRGLAAGSTTITAQSPDGQRATCTVTVVYDPVLSVSIPSALSVGANRRAAIAAVVEPSTATNRNVTWASSNPSVAAVTSTGGQAASIRGVGLGTAVITVTTDDNGHTANCTVTVTQPAAPIIYRAGRSGLYEDAYYNADIGNQILNEVVVDDAGNVHAVGSYYDANANPTYMPAYYRNGARTNLPLNTSAPTRDASARGVFVTGDGTVYISGEFVTTDWLAVARLWKVTPGGAVTIEPLEGVYETGGGNFYSTAYSVKVRNGDVYVSGGSGPAAQPRPCVWKNGARHQFEITSNDWFVDMDFATDGRPFLFGYNGEVYVAETDLTAATLYPMQNKESYYTMSHMCVSGDDVYVVGYYAAQGAWLWKNGVRSDVPRPSGSGRHEANDVFVHEGKVYVSGLSLVAGQIWAMQHWIDGELVVDADRRPNSQGAQIPGRATSIFVKW